MLIRIVALWAVLQRAGRTAERVNKIKTVVGIVKVTPLILVPDASHYVQILISRHNVIEVQRADNWPRYLGFVIGVMEGPITGGKHRSVVISQMRPAIVLRQSLLRPGIYVRRRRGGN